MPGSSKTSIFCGWLFIEIVFKNTCLQDPTYGFQKLITGELEFSPEKIQVDALGCGIRTVSSDHLAHAGRWLVHADGGILRKVPVLWTTVIKFLLPTQVLELPVSCCLVKESKKFRLRTFTSSSFHWAVFRIRKLFPCSTDNSCLI